MNSRGAGLTPVQPAAAAAAAARAAAEAEAPLCSPSSDGTLHTHHRRRRSLLAAGSLLAASSAAGLLLGSAAAQAAAAGSAESSASAGMSRPLRELVAAAKPAWPAAGPGVAFPNYARPGPFSPARLPPLEHTCASCFPLCADNRCLVKLQIVYPRGGSTVGLKVGGRTGGW